MIATINNKPTDFTLSLYKVDYNSWPIDWLVNYIEKKQRLSITETTKTIRQKFSLIYSFYGNRNSDLLQMEKLFNESVKQLYAHMKKEEAGLFPLIREMMLARELNQDIKRPAFATIEAAVMILTEDHKRESERLKWISQIKNSYTALGTSSKMHKALFAILRGFQEDLELHIYLQSKFLFPKIISMKYDVT